MGDAVYVAQQLHVVTTRIESYSQHTADQLQDASYDAWALHHYCISPDFHYWLRHVLPSDAVGYAERVDDTWTRPPSPSLAALHRIQIPSCGVMSSYGG